MLWSALVHETITNVCRYYVEADTEAEARELLEAGETVNSDTLDVLGVTDRQVVSEPRQEPQ